MTAPGTSSHQSEPPAEAARTRPALVAVAVGACLLVIGYALTSVLSNGESDAVAHESNAPFEPGPADVGFAQDMTTHHQQAVTMAELVDGRAGPQVASLADVIKTNQLIEIGQLQGTLELWGEPRFPTAEPMAWMEQHHGGHHAAHTSGRMPGMATQQQLNSLRRLSGKRLDLQFMRLMLRHHKGGVAMANYAAEHAQVDLIKNLAKRMAYDQSLEIERIGGLLHQRS